jgi:hypothetical protein
MGAAVAVILIKERHVAEAFERMGATAPDRAITAQEANVDESGVGWRRLRNRAIVREGGPGRYYLDVEVWQATRRIRRRRVTVVLVLALLATLILGVLGIGLSVH